MSANNIFRHWVASFVTSDEGVTMQEKVWAQLSAKLEKIEPGCVVKALFTN
jgi:hypothetical protein